MLYKGAPPFSMSALYIIMNFNPRAPWGAWIETSTMQKSMSTSRVAPRVGRDRAVLSGQSYTIGFNPRAP